VIECWGRCARCDTVVELVPHFNLPMPVSAVVRWLETATCPTCAATYLLWEVDPHNAPRRGDKVYWNHEMSVIRESAPKPPGWPNHED
jgi:hypothetical protein